MDQAGRLEKGMQASVRWSSIRIVVYATSHQRMTAMLWRLNVIAQCYYAICRT